LHGFHGVTERALVLQRDDEINGTFNRGHECSGICRKAVWWGVIPAGTSSKSIGSAWTLRLTTDSAISALLHQPGIFQLPEQGVQVKDMRLTGGV